MRCVMKAIDLGDGCTVFWGWSCEIVSDSLYEIHERPSHSLVVSSLCSVLDEKRGAYFDFYCPFGRDRP
jgi:hypothetical protein